MTERLRDIVASDDPAVVDLARLVRAAGDLDPRPGAQARVRRALAGRPRVRRRWPTALVAALVLVVVLPVAIAGVRWIVAPPVPPSVPAPVPSRVAPAPPRVPHRAAAAVDPVPPAPETPVPETPAAPVALPAAPRTSTGPIGDGEVAPRAPAAVHAPASAGSGAPVPPPAAPPPPAPEAPPPVRGSTAMPPPASERRPHLPGRATGPVDDAPAVASAVRVRESAHLPVEPRTASAPAAADTALVVEAMRRLRRGHDPQAALRQLDAYLARFPDGDLAEEALALAIEARAVLGDAAACALAEQYLQRYPHGRFRDTAERTQLQLRDPDLQRCPSR